MESDWKPAVRGNMEGARERRRRRAVLLAWFSVPSALLIVLAALFGPRREQEPSPASSSVFGSGIAAPEPSSTLLRTSERASSSSLPRFSEDERVRPAAERAPQAGSDWMSEELRSGGEALAERARGIGPGARGRARRDEPGESDDAGSGESAEFRSDFEHAHAGAENHRHGGDGRAGDGHRHAAGGPAEFEEILAGSKLKSATLKQLAELGRRAHAQKGLGKETRNDEAAAADPGYGK